MSPKRAVFGLSFGESVLLFIAICLAGFHGSVWDVLMATGQWKLHQFELHLVPSSAGIGSDGRGPKVPRPKVYDSLNAAMQTTISVGHHAFIVGPGGYHSVGLIPLLCEGRPSATGLQWPDTYEAFLALVRTV